MRLQAFFNNFDQLAELPTGIPKLRQLILHLAFRGKLVPQFPEDGFASSLLKRIESVRRAEHRNGKAQELPPINVEEKQHDLPTTWEWVRLGDVVEYDCALKISPDQIAADCWLLELEDIEKDSSRIIERFIFADRRSKSSKARFLAGDVLYGKLRPYLNKVIVADNGGYCTTEIVALRGYLGIEPRFLMYALKRPDFIAYVNEKSYGVKMPRLGSDDARLSVFPLPPFEEQKRIVEKVDELLGFCDQLEAQQHAKRESRVRLNTAMLAPLNKAASLTREEFEQATKRLLDSFDTLYDSIDTVGKLRATILQLAIQGKLVSQDRRDECASVLLERIRQQRKKVLGPSDLKKVEPKRVSDPMALPFDVPEGWKWIRLGQIAIKLGAGSTPLGGKNVYPPEGVKFLRSQNVWNHGLQLDNVAYISEIIHREMNGTHVLDGDILLNITGASIGRSCVVPENFGDANVSQHVSIIRLVDKRFRFFLHLCIISPYVQDSIMQAQVGVSREGLSMRNLKEFLLPIPPLAEQKRIVAKVNQLMSLCDELESKLRQAEAHSEKLMNAAVKHVLDSVRDTSNAAEEVFA